MLEVEKKDNDGGWRKTEYLLNFFNFLTYVIFSIFKKTQGSLEIID